MMILDINKTHLFFMESMQEHLLKLYNYMYVLNEGDYYMQLWLMIIGTGSYMFFCYLAVIKSKANLPVQILLEGQTR